MQTKLLYLFTRTPLHVGAGSSVGAIDQPIIRERHTGFPVIPASSLKGTFADAWNDGLLSDGGKRVRVRAEKEGEKTVLKASDAAWLFGSDDANHSFAGAVQLSEGKLLAFPIRSAKGSFGWITCPLMLQRAARDGVIPGFKQDGTPDADYLPSGEPKDEEGIWTGETLAIGEKIVLEEYTFGRAKSGSAEVVPFPRKLAGELAKLVRGDPVWSEIASRLVILSDGMVSFFAQNACEVAQHVRISDETGTAEGGALFNQENVPSETLFYSVVHFSAGRGEKFKERKPADAEREFRTKIGRKAFQFGGDASTGLGYCTIELADERKGAAE